MRPRRVIVHVVLVLAAATPLVDAETRTFPDPIDPGVCSSPTKLVECTLTMRELVFMTADGVEQWTRGYGDRTPLGPTIRVKPGDTLQVTLKNELRAWAAKSPGVRNYYHRMAITNIHTHGLHISGMEPGDSIFTWVDPGEEYTYTYNIPRNHMGGTFWYHPHVHGSTAAQAGGGAAGMLIVEDSPGALPPQYVALPEVELFVSGISVEMMVGIAEGAEACCIAYHNASLTKAEAASICTDPIPVDNGGADPGFKDGYRDSQSAAFESPEALRDACRDDVWGRSTLSPDDKVHLVNGVESPQISIPADTWVRLRVVYAAVDGTIAMNTSTANCEFQLLAKDGVYLHTAPRAVSYAYLGPGSRVDFLARCAAGTQNIGTISLGSHWGGGSDSNRPLSPKVCARLTGTEEVVPTDSEEEQLQAFFEDLEDETMAFDGNDAVILKAPGELLQFLAEEPAERRCELPTFQVARPCYLADLRRATSIAHERDLVFGQIVPAYGFAAAPSRINAQSFGGKDAFMFVEEVGTVSQYNVRGIFSHAYHQHVNPYQLQNDFIVIDGVDEDPYFQAGDWHDTLMLPVKLCPTNADDFAKDGGGTDQFVMSVRTNYDTFTGREVIHCHVLDHEDWGMMTVVDLTGVEGSTYAQAKTLDPTCYLDGQAVGAPTIVTAGTCPPDNGMATWAEAVAVVVPVVSILVLAAVWYAIQSAPGSKQSGLSGGTKTADVELQVQTSGT